MDTLRGNFGSSDVTDDSYDYSDDETGRELPPAAIGQDERRMQVRAYNHWASQLGDANFPSIEDLDPSALTDFGPYSVLLDFTGGIDDPVVEYLGDMLAEECGTDADLEKLSDVPSRSLLSRITDHYMQILANQAPIGFEAEFVNQRGATILYRGILLPYSSDDDTIDFIYGVINWKEMADQVTTDELLLEIDQALEESDDEPHKRAADPVTEWADGPANDIATQVNFNIGNDDGEDEDDLPRPAFGDYYFGKDAGEEDEDEEDDANYDFASLSDHVAAPKEKAGPIDLSAFAPIEEADQDELSAEVQSAGFSAEYANGFDAGFEAADEEIADEPLPADAGLFDCLASARELALAARSSEDRSRSALYAAVGRAYDFSLAAEEEPEEFEALVVESGLTVQERAPMTPVVKLVFGADYDKTRLTEYAAVLSHAHRIGIERGSLAGFLSEADGGLKGVVSAERRLRREESGKAVEPEGEPKAALARKLRNLDPIAFDEIDGEGAEFALVMIRRTQDGEVLVLGEIEQDVPMIERAARKLLG